MGYRDKVKKRIDEIAEFMADNKDISPQEVIKKFEAEKGYAYRTVSRYVKAVKEKMENSGNGIKATDLEIQKLEAILNGTLTAEKIVKTKDGIQRIKCLPNFTDISNAALNRAKIRMITSKK